MVFEEMAKPDKKKESDMGWLRDPKRKKSK
jgi:hypothetical protein